MRPHNKQSIEADGKDWIQAFHGGAPDKVKSAFCHMSPSISLLIVIHSSFISLRKVVPQVIIKPPEPSQVNTVLRTLPGK